MQVARFALANDNLRPPFPRRLRGHGIEGVDLERVYSVAERAFESGRLSAREKVRLADLLEDAEDFEASFRVAMSCLQDEECSDENLRTTAKAIAARTALRLGKRDEAEKLISEIPRSQLRGSLARTAIDLKCETGDKEGAFNVAKTALANGRSLSMVLGASLRLAVELERISKIEEIIRMVPEKERLSWDPDLLWDIERAGLQALAEEIGKHRSRRRR